MISLNKIIQAKRNIADFVTNTTFNFAPKLSKISGGQIFLKKENLQLTGAYKVRGAFNKIASLTQEQKQNGVIAASAGNHAQGVAISARHFGVKAIIVMPEAAPLLKVSGTKALGAEVILKGDNFDEAYSYAVQYAKECGLTFIHPFDDEFVQAGQGTIGLEMLDAVPDLDIIVVPVGGGGLASGVGSCAKQINPNIKVVAVSAKGAPAMFESFNSGELHNSKSVRTIADGIAVRDANADTFGILRECIDEFVLVDDEEIASAILYLLENQKIVVEGAGAVGVAALMERKFAFKENQKIGIVLSGGNIDMQMLNVIIEKGLIKSNRKMIIDVTLIDKPGSMMRLSDALASTGANIVKIDYDRFSTKLNYGDAMIKITLETKGKDHQDEVARILKQNGYEFTQEF